MRSAFRPGQSGIERSSADNESLQADVMRFMAIIAFCLIAILALVKNVEAPQQTESTAVVAKPTRLAPADEPLPSSAHALRQSLAPTPEPPAPAAEAVEEPPDEARHSRLEPPPQGTSSLRSEVLRDSPKPRLQPKTLDASASSRNEGLSLRFASDGDFLRLISRGDVIVFAYREDTVWALGRDYVFRRARAPRQLYELELDTIPQLVSEAFLHDHAGPAEFTWGVSLPRRIESQIESYIRDVEHGVLLIDRYGEVRHVGTS
ncbi:MAG: hypothetical protein P8Y95_07885 [Gammaproteobacteria bacterium]|jgi:hypothetical protein